MFRKALLVGAVTVWSLGMAGCTFYLEDDEDYSYCDSTGCYDCDEFGCWPSDDGGGGGGWSCSDDDDCAAGCACVDGYCEEFGFCETSDDCPEGFECDDRASCVPSDDPEPTPCNDSDDCEEGSYCDLNVGECVEGDEPFTCQGEVTCSDVAPSCPQGSTPEISFGCYTGDCVENTDCPDGNPCSSNTEEQCLGTAECTAFYNGTGCTDSGGNACDPNSPTCTCQTYTFDYCQ